MTYNYNLKQQLPMCEVRFNQILAKNPRPIYRLNSFSSDPYIRRYTNQEMFLSIKEIENFCQKNELENKINCGLCEFCLYHEETKYIL